jgi:hypothetical protein
LLLKTKNFILNLSNKTLLKMQLKQTNMNLTCLYYYNNYCFLTTH